MEPTKKENFSQRAKKMMKKFFGSTRVVVVDIPKQIIKDDKENIFQDQKDATKKYLLDRCIKLELENKEQRENMENMDKELTRMKITVDKMSAENEEQKLMLQKCISLLEDMVRRNHLEVKPEVAKSSDIIRIHNLIDHMTKMLQKEQEERLALERKLEEHAQLIKSSPLFKNAKKEENKSPKRVEFKTPEKSQQQQDEKKPKVPRFMLPTSASAMKVSPMKFKKQLKKSPARSKSVFAKPPTPVTKEEKKLAKIIRQRRFSCVFSNHRDLFDSLQSPDNDRRKSFANLQSSSERK